MDRRESLKLMSLITGGVLFSGLSAAVLQGCTAPAVGAGLKKLSQPQYDDLEAMSEVIIPQTDTPGAREARVAAFIDQALDSAFSEEEQKRFLSGLDTFREGVSAKHGKNYKSLTSDQQQEEMQTLANSGDAYWNMLKRMVMVGYFTSEVGATKALEYIPIPGPYEGCKPMAANQKAWISYP